MLFLLRMPWGRSWSSELELEIGMKIPKQRLINQNYLREMLCALCDSASLR